MSYRDEVRVSRETIHRIRLSRMGTTFVDVGFYPDHKRGTTNGTLSIHGDFGPFEYAWTSTGCRYFYEFLAGMRYDYAMGKLCGARREAYDEDWSTLPAKLKAEVVSLRSEDELTALEARTLYDYFNGDTLVEHFAPQSYEEYRHAMEQEVMTNFGRKDRRDMEWMVEDPLHEDPAPINAMYGGDPECMPTPDCVRAEPYFWDEVWPVVVDEIRKLELSLHGKHVVAEDCATDGA